jgi:hypothetical protein
VESGPSVRIVTRVIAGLARPAADLPRRGMASAPPGVRPRSTAAIVLSRADPGSSAAVRVITPGPERTGRWFWLWWIPLGALVAGAWALLILGDSLR